MIITGTAHRSPAPWSLLCGTLIAAACGVGCKNRGVPPCNPVHDQDRTAHVLIQPGGSLNPDANGDSLALSLRIYQLKGTSHVERSDFETVWRDGGQAAFAGDYVGEMETTVYPHTSDVLRLKLESATTDLAAVAIVRQPVGRDWIRTWSLPRDDDATACRKARQTFCFYVLLDQYHVKGGNTPPPGLDSTSAPTGCQAQSAAPHHPQGTRS